MKQIHWLIIWFVVLIFLLGILNPNLIDRLIFRAWGVFWRIAGIVIAFGILIVGIRKILFRR